MVNDHVVKIKIKQYFTPEFIVVRMKEQSMVAIMEIWYDMENKVYEELELFKQT